MSRNEVSKKKIYVLVLMTVMDRAGAETMVMNYLRHIDRNKIQMDFLINRAEQSDYEKEIRSLGSKVYHMSPLYPGKFHQYKKEFRDFLQKHPEYKIIHSHLEERSYYALKIAKEEGVPVRIAHAHSVPKGHDMKMIMRRYFRKKLDKYYTHAFACGEKPARWLFGNTEHVTIMKNAIDTDVFQYDENVRAKIRKSLKIKEKELVIGHIGRFVEEKNQMFLVDIFNEVHNQCPDSRLLFIGGGKPKTEVKYKEKVRKKVRELGLGSKVQFLGVRKDINELLQGIDVLVMPSVSEGFPVVLVEAQSAGTLCLVSDVVSNEVNVTGELQYQGIEQDAVEWANKILSMAQDHMPRKGSEDERLEGCSEDEIFGPGDKVIGTCSEDEVFGSGNKKELAGVVEKSGLGIRKNAKWLEDFYESISDEIKVRNTSE